MQRVLWILPLKYGIYQIRLIGLCWNRNFTNHTNVVFGLEWINEDTIASGGYDNTTKIWSILLGEAKRTIYTGLQVRSLKLLSNGFYLACGFLNGNIYIFDISNNGSLISTLIGHASYLNDLIQISDDLFASSSWDKTVLIWNLTTNSIIYNLTGHSTYVYGLQLISSDLLASGSNDKTIKVWNITNGKCLRNLTGHTGKVQWSLDSLSNSQTLVSGSLDQTIKLWNIKTGECSNTFNTSLQIQTLTLLKSSIATTSKYLFSSSFSSSYSKKTC